MNASDAWVRPIFRRSGPAPMRLFCFPYAGAGASAFRNWGAGLPADVQAFAIQLPGREERFYDAPIDELDRLLHELLPHLLPFLDRPFAFFGHSMGAVVSSELAKRLVRDHGIEPSRVIVAGCRAPRFHESRQPTDAELSDAHLVEELRRLNGTPEEFLREPEFISFVLPAFRADRALFVRYGHRPGAQLSCPVSVFGGTTDPRVRRGHLQEWSELTTGRCEVEMFPGGHLFLNEVPDLVVGSVARLLSRTTADPGAGVGANDGGWTHR